MLLHFMFFMRVIIEFILPTAVGILIVAFGVTFCGMMLGLTPDLDKDKNKDVRKEGKVEVDEMTRISVEMAGNTAGSTGEVGFGEE